MASFDPCFERTMNFEGKILENNVGDPGKETFWGISRVYNPAWAGWKIIDTLGPNDQTLPGLVATFYQTKYWLSNSFNLLTSQELAAQLFDACVNLGSGDVILGLEDLLGTEIDGVMGPNDITACNSATNIIMPFIAFRKGFYRGLAVLSPEDKMDLKGLESRCVLAGF